MDNHKIYSHNNFILQIPDNIKKRTENYLNNNCDILNWFKSTYVYVDSKKTVLSIKDIHQNFISSIYYENLSKTNKQKYSHYGKFKNYIINNVYLKKYYVLKTRKYNNIIVQHREKTIEELEVEDLDIKNVDDYIALEEQEIIEIDGDD